MARFSLQIILIQFVVAFPCSSHQREQEQHGRPFLELSSYLQQPEEEWDYEPRIWTIEEHQQQEGIDTDDSPSDNYELELETNLREQQTFDRSRDVYFLSQVIKLRQENDDDFEGDQTEAPPPPPATKPEECTQFRVDTREAVVCDRSRCDKLDFQWPIHNNHLIMIQTTQEGMRFHKADFTFNARPRTRSISTKHKPEKIKFDLLELFKPSTTTTTTTTITTAAPTTTTTTELPTTTNEPTTEATSTSEETTVTTPSAPSVTTFVPYFSTVSSTSSSRAINTSQDSNNTQLVTTFRLDTKRMRQKMIGFGGALSDSTCRNIKSLSPEMARNLMDDYYGDRGLRYSIARLSIGSSDFSTTPYTNNDREDAFNKKKGSKLFTIDPKDDVEMNSFHLVDEDYQYKLPVARQAIATSRNREIKFFSSLWSPPIWMKNNSHIVHGYLKGDVYGPYYKALAEYIIKWHEAYRRNGLEFWATTGLNEPVTGVKPFIFHNSLGMSKSDYVTFIKLYLGPMLKQRGFQNTKLLILDDNKGYAPNWVKQALNDDEVSKFISGIAFHWYMNDEYENLNFLEKYHSDKFIISSEASNGFLPFQPHPMPGDWNRGVAYIYDIIKMIQKNSAAWVDWNMALDLNGGPSWAKNHLDSPIIINSARDEYYKSPMFYAIGHFSRFVEPDSRRLDYIIANAKFDYPVEAVAFYTPKQYIVIIALNSNKHSVPFKVIVDKQLIKILTLRANSFNTIVFRWKTKN